MIYTNNMSFSRSRYESCAYKHRLNESVGPGEYALATPQVCDPCFVPSPAIHVGGSGASVCGKELIDVDSELLGLTRKASQCPGNKYIPSDKEFCKKRTLRECNDLDPENTRLSNPPCTLRGRGWNRWEWLCQNPQDKVEMPFDWNISNRTIVKDSHRPCIPRPLDQTLALPPQSAEQHVPVFCGAPFREPNVQCWESCDKIKRL